MEEGFNRFKNRLMDKQELERFRADIDSMTDEQIDAYLNEMAADDAFHRETIDSLHQRIYEEIGADNRHARIYKITSIAASILVPLLIVSGIYFYHKSSTFDKYRGLLSREITTQTGPGEKAVTMLPDGSTVELGPDSRLHYTLETFNDEQRHVSWDGEGHFNIAKIKRTPFIVASDNFIIEVLGTEFDVLTRHYSDIAEISLLTGSIRLTASASPSTDLIMKPGETAIVNKRSGVIELLTDDSDYRPSVGRMMISFSSEPLSEVLECLELYYGRPFVVASDTLAANKFTGALPTNDLHDALKILEKSFHMKSDISPDSITLSQD